MDTDKLPDFVVLLTRGSTLLTWFVIEMKTTTSDAGAIVAQLQSGATTIQSHERFAGLAHSASIFPLVFRARSGQTHVADYQTLQRRRIRFAGKQVGITLQRCGYDLSTLV